MSQKHAYVVYEWFLLYGCVYNFITNGTIGFGGRYISLSLKRSLAATAQRVPPYFETILRKFCSTFLHLNISDCPVVKDLRYWIWMKKPIF